MIINKIDIVSKFIPLMDGEVAVAEVIGYLPEEGDDIQLIKSGEDLYHNYTFVFQKNGTTSVIGKMEDLCTFFDMDEESAKMFCEYAGSALNGNLPLTILKHTSGYLIQNDWDVLQVSEGKDPRGAIEEYANVSGTGNVISALISHSYVQTFLVKLLEAGQRRFNQIHFYNKVDDIADIIRGIQFMNDDGVLQQLNITGVDNLFSNVKDKLLIQK